jgi:homocysteine S-methyltransferase
VLPVERLRRSTAHPIVVDGGLATELERRGHDVSGPLWSAHALLDAPDAIEQLHYDYFAAGADVVISASYQASYEGFAALGLSDDETTSLLRRSVSLALAARDRVAGHTQDRDRAAKPNEQRTLLVAASVGPYGAVRHDGSEYHGRYGLSVRELTAFHARRLDVLAGSGADVIACETIPSLDEVRALIAVLRAHPGMPAWVSMTSRDGVHTAHGEPLADCARELDAVESLVAIGVNCVHPTVVGGAIRSLATATDKPIVVYPNSGEEWDAAARQWRGAPAGLRLAERVPAWLDAGARLIGGCCRTGPSDIRALRQAIHARALS